MSMTIPASQAARRPDELDRLVSTFGPILLQAFPEAHSVTRFQVANALAQTALTAIRDEVGGDEDALIKGLREQIEGVVEFSGRGCWVTCTGCAESSEGVLDSRYYPRSKVLGCQLGGGCSECGGIGAVWDDTDYEDMARHMLAEDATPPAAEPVGDGVRAMKSLAEQMADDAALIASLSPEIRAALDRELALIGKNPGVTFNTPAEPHEYLGGAGLRVLAEEPVGDGVREAAQAVMDAYEGADALSLDRDRSEIDRRFMALKQALASAPARGEVDGNLRRFVKDVLIEYQTDCDEALAHPGPYADKILAALRPTAPGEVEKLREAVAFIDKFFEPWGAWKTAWWEGEVSDHAAFSADNALKHVANMLRPLLSPNHPERAKEEGE